MWRKTRSPSVLSLRSLSGHLSSYPSPHRSPHMAQAVSSPGLLPQPPGWYPASTLPPADSAQRGRQAGTPASAQNLSVVPTVAQKARQGVHDLPVTALTPSPPPPFLTPSVPATLASGGFPCLQPHFRTLAPATPPSYMLFPQIQVHCTASSPSGRYSKVTSPWSLPKYNQGDLNPHLTLKLYNLLSCFVSKEHMTFSYTFWFTYL